MSDEKRPWHEEAAGLLQFDPPGCAWELLTEALAEREESVRSLRKTLGLLRDFYVAYYKPDWAEGRTADDMTDEIRIYLDQAAREGFAEAQVPPDGDDPGGPEEGDRD